MKIMRKVAAASVISAAGFAYDGSLRAFSEPHCSQFAYACYYSWNGTPYTSNCYYEGGLEWCYIVCDGTEYAEWCYYS